MSPSTTNEDGADTVQSAQPAPRFRLPALNTPATAWGPPSALIPAQFRDIPYAPFAKSDRLTRIADWTQPSQQEFQMAVTGGRSGGGAKRGGAGGGAGGYGDQTYGSGAQSAFAYTHAEGEDGGGAFSLVVTAQGVSTGPSFGPGQRKQTGGWGAGAGGPGASGRGPRQFQRTGGQGAGQGGGQGAGGGGGTRGGFGGGGQRYGQGGGGRWGASGGYGQARITRDVSCKIGTDWKVVEEWEYHRLAKLSYPGVDSTQAEDLAFRGACARWDRNMERITTRTSKPLPSTAPSMTTPPTASHDPVMRDLATAYPGAIYAVDSVLSLIMCCTRTVYPWDLRVRVSRRDGSVWFDRRDPDAGRWSVNENASEVPPEEKDAAGINSAQSLEREAHTVNTRFLGMSIVQNDIARGSDGAAVVDSALPVLHRYRRFVLEEVEEDEDEEAAAAAAAAAAAGASTSLRPWDLIVRTELSATAASVASHTADVNASYVSVIALNEFDPRAVGAGNALDWRAKLDGQRGAVLATELKNNGLKLARWCVQAVLAGANGLRLGYVSRRAPKDLSRGWEVLGVQSFKPKELAVQMNLGAGQAKSEGVGLEQGWGVLRAVVSWARRAAARDTDSTEGDVIDFVLVKDPAKPTLRLYRVPGTLDL